MNVIWLSVKQGTPPRGYWDQRLLEEVFEDQNHIEADHIDPVEEAIVVIPGAYQAPFIKEINYELSKVKHLTVVITSDEENNFPIDDLRHSDMRIFANYYNPGYKSDINWIPIGPANTYKYSLKEKTNDFVFAGQVTHQKREDYIKEIRDRTDGVLIETEGFAQGLDPKKYFELLTTAKVVPSPAGNVCPEAFRTYEAIVAGAVPITTDTDWHNSVFGEVPFPVVDKYEQINGYINDAINQYPKLNNKVQMWWLMEKWKIKSKLVPNTSDVTIIIPCSPIKSHPDTKIIDETIKTIRHHLPKAQVIVTFDGVREEHEDRRADYEEFKRRFLWRCFNEEDYKNIICLDFTEHSHQVKMAREALKLVDTDLILYVEQDTPLTPDVEIEWQKCIDFIRTGEANVIRFHFESFIPEAHEHMMIADVENGFLRTSQWSQRPHLASKAYYERVLSSYFTEHALTFVEDKMHSILYEAYKNNGLQGWYQHRVWIYYPEGNIKRSYHTDGRAGEKKYDRDLIF